MSDIVKAQGDQLPHTMKARYRDMGDGSHALVLSLPTDNPSEVLLYGLIDDTTKRKLRSDASTHALNLIEYSHHEIHSGDHFYVKDYEDLGNGATYNILFVTPDTERWCHLFFDFWHELEMTFTITEGVTTDADGTAVAERNSNRNSTTEATVVVTHTPTNPIGGVVIYSYQRGTAQKGGGEKRAEDEIVLRQNRKYLITATNTVANSCMYDYHFRWYEHTDKD